MNYKKHYTHLIEKAKHRKLSGYFESHHIIPKCMGGNDELDNLVNLTAREHFIAHLLLVKIYKGNLRLVKAVAMMCVGNSKQTERKLTNRLYGNLRELFSLAQSESQSGEKNSQYGKKWIYNPYTKEEKKIHLNQLPDGWLYGRYPEKRILKKQKKEANKILKIKHYDKQKELYNSYYKIYKEVGFDEFVKITGYEKSKPNLVTRFAHYVNGFVPQNGKKRAKKN